MNCWIGVCTKSNLEKFLSNPSMISSILYNKNPNNLKFLIKENKTQFGWFIHKLISNNSVIDPIGIRDIQFDYWNLEFNLQWIVEHLKCYNLFAMLHGKFLSFINKIQLPVISTSENDKDSINDWCSFFIIELKRLTSTKFNSFTVSKIEKAKKSYWHDNIINYFSLLYHEY